MKRVINNIKIEFFDRVFFSDGNNLFMPLPNQRYHQHESRKGTQQSKRSIIDK